MDMNGVTPGICGVCKQPKFDVNGKVQCLDCNAPKPKKKAPVVEVEDPGESYFKTGRANFTPINKPKASISSGTIDDALKIMKHLPMPNDVKQFKKIKKIIKDMESLIGDQNVDDNK